MAADRRSEKTEGKQQDQEQGTTDSSTIAYKTVKDDASLAAPLLHQFWGFFKKRLDFFRRYTDLFGYVHWRLLSDGMSSHRLRITNARIHDSIEDIGYQVEHNDKEPPEHQNGQ